MRWQQARSLTSTAGSDLPGPWAGHSERADLQLCRPFRRLAGRTLLPLIVYVEPQVSVALTGNADSENLQALSIELADLFAGLDSAATED